MLFQKKAIWRQMQEYREALNREKRRSDALQTQRDGLSLGLNFVMNFLGGSAPADMSRVIEGLQGDFLASQTNHNVLEMCQLLVQGLGKDTMDQSSFVKYARYLCSSINTNIDSGRGPC